MSLFDDKDNLGGKQKTATIGDKTKVPETPDFTEWGKEPRPGNPFALSDFSSGAPVNTTKP